MIWPLNKLKAILDLFRTQIKELQDNQAQMQQSITEVHEKAQQDIELNLQKATEQFNNLQVAIDKNNNELSEQINRIQEENKLYAQQLESLSQTEQGIQDVLGAHSKEITENTNLISKVRKEILDIIDEKSNLNNDKFYHADINYIDAMFHLCDGELPNNSKRYADLKDTHKGEKCFIIGNGPSLKMEDLEVLRENKIQTFAVNRIYLAFDKVQWRPDYYMCQDYLVVENFWDDIVKHFKNTTCFFPYQIITENHKNLVGLDAILFPFKIINPRPAWFSYSTDRAIHEGMTVVFSAMQVAEHMGFSEVYLLGVDFNYFVNKDESGKDVLDRDKKSYFTDKYIEKDLKIFDPQMDVSLEAFLSAQEYSDNHNIKFYNATRGGNLEAFPRVYFDDLFKK